MRHQRSRLLVGMLLGAALPLGLSPVHGQADKGADRAKNALVQFGATVAAADLDGLLKAVDVPFYHNANDPDKGEVIRDREGLKKLMQQLLSASKGKKVQLEVAEVLSYAKFLEAFGGELPKGERELLDEVLAKGGYALRVEVKDAEGKQLYHWVCFVSSRGDGAKVVGLRN